MQQRNFPSSSCWLAQKRRRRRVVAQVAGERAVRAELHHRAPHPVGLRLGQRNRVAEEHEPRLAEQVLVVAGEERAVRDAVHAERLARVLHEGGHVLRPPPATARSRAAGSRTTPAHPPAPGWTPCRRRRCCLSRCAGWGSAGAPSRPPRRTGRPRPTACTSASGQVLLQQRQHARGVGDVADVHHLPRRAQQDPGPPAGLPGAERRGERGDERGVEEAAAVHGGEGCDDPILLPADQLAGSRRYTSPS